MALRPLSEIAGRLKGGIVSGASTTGKSLNNFSTKLSVVHQLGTKGSFVRRGVSNIAGVTAGFTGGLGKTILQGHMSDLGLNRFLGGFSFRDYYKARALGLDEDDAAYYASSKGKIKKKPKHKSSGKDKTRGPIVPSGSGLPPTPSSNPVTSSPSGNNIDIINALSPLAHIETGVTAVASSLGLVNKEISQLRDDVDFGFKDVVKAIKQLSPNAFQQLNNQRSKKNGNTGSSLNVNKPGSVLGGLSSLISGLGQKLASVVGIIGGTVTVLRGMVSRLATGAANGVRATGRAIARPLGTLGTKVLDMITPTPRTATMTPEASTPRNSVASKEPITTPKGSLSSPDETVKVPSSSSSQPKSSSSSSVPRDPDRFHTYDEYKPKNIKTYKVPKNNTSTSTINLDPIDVPKDKPIPRDPDRFKTIEEPKPNVKAKGVPRALGKALHASLGGTAALLEGIIGFDQWADAYDAYKAGKMSDVDFRKETLKIVSGALSGLGGAAIGSIAGAVLGSGVPVVGTAIGGIAGGIAGGVAGGYVGPKIGEAIFDKLVTPEQQQIQRQGPQQRNSVNPVIGSVAESYRKKRNEVLDNMSKDRQVSKTQQPNIVVVPSPPTPAPAPPNNNSNGGGSSRVGVGSATPSLNPLDNQNLGLGINLIP